MPLRQIRYFVSICCSDTNLENFYKFALIMTIKIFKSGVSGKDSLKIIAKEITKDGWNGNYLITESRVVNNHHANILSVTKILKHILDEKVTDSIIMTHSEAAVYLITGKWEPSGSNKSHAAIKNAKELYRKIKNRKYNFEFKITLVKSLKAKKKGLIAAEEHLAIPKPNFQSKKKYRQI